ncbi:MAG: hypothetical protein PX637_14885 [Microcystis sp. M53601_WE4]|nr:hypothetical protein [Microcystis sp. M53601_WE4]
MLLTSQFPSMCMVRSQKSIAGAVGLALGNAPYGDSDRLSLSPKSDRPWRSHPKQ